MKLIIDRFEGEFAIVELNDKSMINMPKKLVPSGAKEGEVLEVRIDRDETEKRKMQMKRLSKELWE